MEDMRDIEDESYTDSQDLVEYTTEEQEEEEEEQEEVEQIDLEELVEETNQPDVSTDEEYEQYEDDEKPARIQILDSSPAVQTIRNTVSLSGLQKVGNNIGVERSTAKIMMVPQSSTSTASPMKLLNTARPSLPSTIATTSYRVLNSDGTMIVNVSNKPAAAKKVISVTSPGTAQSNPANRVVLNTNAARVMHIQPQNVPTSSGAGLKTMTVGKTVTMKTLPGGAIKLEPQSAAYPSGVQGTLVRVAKPPAPQTVSLGGTTKIVKQNTPIGGSDLSKVIIKPGIGNAPTKITPAGALHAVTLPGGKGVQYVRLLNQRPTTASGTVQKIVLKSPSKISNISSSSVAASTSNVVSTTGISGTVQSGSPKIIMHNNRTIVVRNGAGNLATLPSTATVGKPSVLSTSRKIILNSEAGAGATRIVLSKEDTKQWESKHNYQTVALKSRDVSNGSSLSEKDVVEEESVRKQDQYIIETIKESLSNSGHLGGGNVKDNSKDIPSKNSTVYGFPDEAYKKRPCNCTKSQCLKLYCDCFANGEYCYNCNCKDCFNTFDHNNEREKAVRSTLERNPNAFKPKIGSIGSTDDGTRLHTKGCNCKRSGCLKNYCECYEGKIACSSNCKCVGCRNTEQFTMDYDYYSSNDASRKSIDDRSVSLIIPDKIAPDVGPGRTSLDSVRLKRSSSVMETDLSHLPPTKQPHNFMTMDVIEATVQCMVAQADECLKRGCSMRTSELMILEEYGRCLLEIKEFAFNTEN